MKENRISVESAVSSSSLSSYVLSPDSQKFNREKKLNPMISSSSSEGATSLSPYDLIPNVAAFRDHIFQAIYLNNLELVKYLNDVFGAIYDIKTMKDQRGNTCNSHKFFCF